MLEIIREIPDETLKGSIVFAHGICHGAWCWYHFTDFFRSRGYACYALSYRGHGKSDGKKGSLEDNAIDVGCVVDIAFKETGYKPYLVGHSMGGAVVQKYAGKNQEKISGLILLASATAPKMPFWKSVKDTFTHKDMRISFWKAVGIKMKNLRESAFFTGSTEGLDEADYKLAEEKIENESIRVLMFGLYKKYSSNYTIPCKVMVIGSKTDRYFPEPSLKQTRDTYENAGCTVTYIKPFEGICHDMMLDKRWREPAEKILRFIEE